MSENYIEKIQYGKNEYEIRDSRLSAETTEITELITDKISTTKEKESGIWNPLIIKADNFSIKSQTSTLLSVNEGGNVSCPQITTQGMSFSDNVAYMRGGEDGGELSINYGSFYVNEEGLKIGQNQNDFIVNINSGEVIVNTQLILNNYQIKIVEGDTTDDILSPKENTLYILVPPTETEVTE